MSYIYFLFYSFTVKMQVSEVYFFSIFFSLFSIHSYVFPNNLVFKICLCANHFYVFFFEIFTFLKIYLVFSKLFKK